MIALKASYEVRKMMRSLVDVDCRIYGLLVKSTHHRLREVASIHYEGCAKHGFETLKRPRGKDACLVVIDPLSVGITCFNEFTRA